MIARFKHFISYNRLVRSSILQKYRYYPTFVCNNRLSTMSPSEIKIGTHDGCFHCDEVLACYMLKLLPRYKDASIIRSRDQKILDQCDIVVDVGGVYDPSKHRYDHHMREFTESLSTVIKKPGYDCNIKLSSAGLIYCHFGSEIIRQLIPEVTDEKDIGNIFKRVYDTFIKEIDGIDNGVPMYDGEPVYRIVTHLSARVARLNPNWTSEDLIPDEQFKKALVIVGEEFTYFVRATATIWWPARSIVRDAILQRFKIDPSGEIIELDRGLPWKEHLFSLEKELDVEVPIKYVIFCDKSYRVNAVPVESGSFICRLFLPEEWRGLRDEELSNVSGIKDCIFVHSSGFIGGNKSRDGAIAMARKALKLGQLSCKKQ